ncbi:O-antigen ligase family protein [Flavobacterium notoginsengisoli]|uniref:O-antigen ligase family protein n=1 Tax=Flavobacterium notoginsengisoli TaxID=1478199 RepID=UPI003625F02F
MFGWIILKTKSKIKYYKEYLIIILFLLLITVFGIITAVVQGNDTDYAFAFGFLKSMLILVLLIVVVDTNIDIGKYVIKYSILIPIITFIIYCLPLYNVVLFGQVYDYIVGEKETLMIAYRNFYGYDVFMVYYKTSPVLVFPLSYYCSSIVRNGFTIKRMILIIMLTVCLVLSGTRANMLSALFVIIYWTYIFLKERKNAFYSLVVFASVFTAITMFALSLSFEKKEASSEIKSGHFISIIDTFEEHPQYLIWGQGLGSKFYSIGGKRILSQVELTYVELIRYFGIPLGVFFIIMMVYPLINIINNKRVNGYNQYIIPAFFSYLFICGTNPLLVSSTGMLIMIIMYSYIHKDFTVEDKKELR